MEERIFLAKIGMFVAWTRVVALKVVDSNWSGNGL